MFEDLRAAFREAVDNFNKELNRDQVPETVDKLLKGMVDEITDAKTAAGELENQIARSRQRAEKEKAEAETARRREKMARDIGDEETAAVAADYAAKHEEHLKLLQQKVVALEAELRFQNEQIDSMMAQVKDAKAKRESLGATAGRSEARESISAADDLFAELERMAEKIGDEDAAAEAAQAFSDLDLERSEYHISMDAPPKREEKDYDAALEELKRRMGKQE